MGAAIYLEGEDVTAKESSPFSALRASFPPVGARLKLCRIVVACPLGGKDVEQCDTGRGAEKHPPICHI